MKVNDTATLTLTGRQLAKLYAVLGFCNGPTETSCWGEVQECLGDNAQVIYDEFFRSSNGLYWKDTDYNSYYKEWEAAILESEDEKIKEIAELKKQLQGISNRIAQLEGE